MVTNAKVSSGLPADFQLTSGTRPAVTRPGLLSAEVPSLDVETMSRSYLVFKILSHHLPCDVTFAPAAASLVQVASVASPVKHWLRRLRIARKAVQQWKRAGARSRLRNLCAKFGASWHGESATYNEQHAAFLDRWSTGRFTLGWNPDSSALELLNGLKAVLILAKSSGDHEVVGSHVQVILRIVETTGTWVCRNFQTYMAWIPTIRSIHITEKLFEIEALNDVLQAQACGPESGGGLYLRDFLDMVHLPGRDLAFGDVGILEPLQPEVATRLLGIIMTLPYPVLYAFLVQTEGAFALTETLSAYEGRDRTLFNLALQQEDLVGRIQRVMEDRNSCWVQLANTGHA